MSKEETKMVTLKSSDGEVFEVQEEVATKSQTLKEMIEDKSIDTRVILLPNVSAKILAKVIDYSKKHVEALKNPDDTKPQEDELKTWDAEFVKVDQATLFDLILAADYLNIKNLLDLTRQTVGYMFKGKMPEEIRKMFNMVTLKSSDGEVFEVEEEVATETIKHVIKDECVDTGFSLPNVSSKILAKVIEYCKKHVDALKNPDDTKLQEEELKTWDAEFVKVDQATLFDLILAANYLKIRNLLDLTCQTVADMIKGKTPEEIKKTFNIKNNYTPEEEEEIRRENQWAFE